MPMPMWTSVDELHQIWNIENSNQNNHKMKPGISCKGYEMKKNEIKNMLDKLLLTWSQIKMYQTPLQKIL